MSDDLTQIKKEIRKGNAAVIRPDRLPDYLSMSESTIRRVSKQPGFPPMRKIATGEDTAIKVYLKSDIDNWLLSAPINRAG